MLGIISCGVYIPFYRLGWDEIAKAWAGKAPKGEKAVANHDEDSITMGVEAAINCLGSLDRKEVDGLYFATTTSPYKEKQCSSLIAAALDLRDDIITDDCTNSLRSGTIALRTAINAIKAGAANKVLVISSDCRIGAPGSQFERLFGDGAAAFLLGRDNAAVALEGSYSISQEFMDVWRTEDDIFPRSWEERFIINEGYLRTIHQGISGIMDKYNLKTRDFSRVVLYGPDPGSHSRAARSFGFDLKDQVQPPPFGTIGNTGSSFSLIMLVSALEEAEAGDRILLVGYGDGCDTSIMTVNKKIENISNTNRKGVKYFLSSKRPLPSYNKYAGFRNLIARDVGATASQATFLPWLWRDRRQILSLYGGRCKGCGVISFPIQRVCDVCLKKDEFEEVRLSDRKGKVFTFSLDNLAPGAESPVVITIVDLDGGGRLRCEMTDFDTEEVKIGMDVDLTFRKMHDARGIHHYFWKSRPLRWAYPGK